MKEVISINGQFYDRESAKISVFDRGFLFGDAVYEVTRSYGKILFQIEAHIERLFKSAERIGLDLAVDTQSLMKEMYRVYRAADCENMYLRIQATRGQGALGLDPSLANTGPNIVIYILDMAHQSTENYIKGVSVATTNVVRNSKASLDPNIKSGNYLNNIMAVREGKKRKAYESLFINAHGFVTEGATSNVFLVKNGVIKTPPKEHEILFGITRGLIINGARKKGFELIETGFRPEDLHDADEVFITSSTREVMPVSEVDGRQLTEGPGEITKKLMEIYSHIVHEYCKTAESKHPWK